MKCSDLSINLKSLIESRHDLNEAKLSRELNIPQPTLHRLINGATTNPTVSTLLPIAEYFNVSLDQLLGLSPLNLENSREQSTVKGIQVPIIQWEQAHTYENLLPTITPKNWDDWVITNLNLKPNSFAVRVNCKTMPLPFSSDSIHIVETGGTISTVGSNVVIIHSLIKRTAHLRYVAIDGNDIWLLPINKRLSPEKLDDTWIYCGIIKQHILTVNSDNYHAL